MKSLVVILCFAFSSVSFSAIPKLTMDDGKTGHKPVSLIEVDKVKVSASCKTGSGYKCMALTAVKKIGVTLSPPKTPLYGNPAARYCLDHGGLNRILKDNKRNEYDYCEFKDGSLVDAWDLLDAHKQQY